jgi:hypothetical protein
MTYNSPTGIEWKKLYQKAVEFRNLKPWEWMGDEELFAVRNPETGETAYCCVMGQMGEFLGMAAYRGADGLETFFQIQSGQISPDDPDILYLQKALLVSYEDRDEIGDEDYDVMRGLGLRFRGKNRWPMFRSLRPHYYPWLLEKDEAQFLTLILEQALDVCKRLKNEPELLMPPSFGEIFIRIPEKTVEGLEWKDGWMDPDDAVGSSITVESDSFIPGKSDSPIPGEEPSNASLPDMNELLELKKDGTWEVDFYYYPEAMQEEEDERPYFPATITWAGLQTREMMEVGLYNPSQWKSSFPETFQKSVLKANHLPEIIHYEDEELLPLLEPIASQLDIKLEEVFQLEVLGEVRENVLESAEENPLSELLDGLMEDESLVKLLEIAMEDENLAALIQNGKIDEFYSDEKVQNLIQDDGEDSGGIPVIFLDQRLENRFQSREDKTSQTYFPTDSGESELLKPENSVYQFIIELEGIQPPIWRRILIPGNSTLRDLHQAIQDVMGWQDYHMHQFRVPDPFSGNPLEMKNHDEKKEIIGDYFTMETPYGEYIYDFGDYWEHTILLEMVTSLDEGATYPRCIEGERAAPPEDCGGVGGYLEMLEVLEDPEDEEYQETVEWLGKDFNPEKFNPEDVVFRDIE